MKTTVVAIAGSVVVFAAAAAGVLVLRGRSADPERASSAPFDEAAPEEISGTADGALELLLLAQTATASAPTADGQIAPGEYRNRPDDPQTGMTLFWQHDGTNLRVGLVSPGTGWAGVGFSDRTGKPGSNIIIGAVRNGQVTIKDDYGVTKSMHAVDRTSSLLAVGGTEADGQTTLEFAIPLASGEAQDVSLVPEQAVQSSSPTTRRRTASPRSTRATR